MNMKRIYLFLLLLVGSYQSTSSVPHVRNAVITGTVIYPSEVCPIDIKAVAVNVVSGETYEQELFKKRSGRTQGLAPTYKLKVPPGTYKLYATSEQSFEKGYKAYYTEFVECGMSVSCTSHEVILIELNKGEKRQNITLGDWYM